MDLNIDNNKLNNSAVKKPLTAKPVTNFPAKSIMTAFITNKNKPNVSNVAGKVKNTNKGLTNIFNNAIVKATTTAVVKLSTKIPGKILDKKITATAVNNNFNKNFIFYLFYISNIYLP